MVKVPNSVSRRGILGGGVTLGLLGATSLSAQIANTPKTSSTNLTVNITLGGMTYSYPNGPTIPSYYVGFRDDGRIVFHLGALGDLKKANVQPSPYNLGAHHVKIQDGARVVFEADIPNHWWNAEWTYRPAPLSVKKTPSQIVAANRMFPFGDIGAKIGQTADYVFKGPMDSAGITIYMPSTGERPDIGLITDASASYMLGGKPGPMLAWAQAAGSCPVHFRDEKTGKPIDLRTYPQANSYSGPQQGAPWLIRGPKDKDGWPEFGGGWTPQQAHYCEMSYLAHVATLDSGFLEDLQYSANFTVLSDGYASKPTGAIVYGELRGVAWAFRNLFMAHVATQDAEVAGTLPASCHPASYFKTILDNQLKYYTEKYKNDPANQYFRLVTAGDRFGPWQCDYMLSSLAFGVLTGHSDWTPMYVWALGNVIARTNGTSGYPPGWGGAYYLNTHEWARKPDGTLDQNQYDQSKPLDWYKAFLYQTNDPNGERLTPAQIEALKVDPFNGGKAMVGGEYLMATRAVLAMANYLDKKGFANVRVTYPELEKCIATANRMVRANGSVNPRDSIAD